MSFLDIMKNSGSTTENEVVEVNNVEVAAEDIVSEQGTIQEASVNEDKTHVDGEFICEETDVINLINLNQTFKSDKGDFTLFKDFNLDIKDFKDVGQFVSIMGQSGCGKSTLLNYIAGLAKPTSGTIKIYGKEQTEKDSIPMVFQSYSSYPWLNVRDNVALPQILKGVNKKEANELAMEKLRMVGLEEHAHKYPNKLSGGQQQRVAIARALNCDSKLLILDEYSSGLDMFTKYDLQDLLMKLFNDEKVDRTFLLVTHDISEAVFLSNRIYVLGANPCKINEVIDVNLGKFRDREIRKTKEFEEYHMKVVNAFNK